jgi:tryptophanyl-tRNA synthetase
MSDSNAPASTEAPPIASDIDVLSGVQPTAQLHIGNYFGAIANWVELQEKYRCVYGVVDLHAMTMPYDADELRANTRAMFADLMACGLDPERCILFVQSLVPEHSELNWLLGCLCSYGDLTRMTQFKDKSDQIGERGGKFVSSGLFTYPVLQAADILVYRAKYVPVGKDQEQHLELSRTLANRFNERFGAIFPEPRALFTNTPKVMSLADPEKKMSKSLGDKHHVALFEDEETVRAKVKTAVTDSGAPPEGMEISPGVANLLEILTACGQGDDAKQMREEYDAGTLKYSLLKSTVADALVVLTSGLRERRREILEGKDVDRLMHEQSARAREHAAATLERVRPAVGIPTC